MSIGGTTGLFVGASVLSFVELIFYFSVRFANNIWAERQKRKPNAVIEVKSYRVDKTLEKIQQGPYENSGVRNLRLYQSNNIFKR